MNWNRGNDITEFGGGFNGIVYVKILTTIDNKCYFSYSELRKKINLKKETIAYYTMAHVPEN